MSYGEAIRHFREKAEVSQEKLALKLEIKTEVLDLIEKGEKIPGMSQILKIAEELKTTAHEIMLEANKDLDTSDITEEDLANTDKFMADVKGKNFDSEEAQRNFFMDTLDKHFGQE